MDENTENTVSLKEYFDKSMIYIKDAIESTKVTNELALGLARTESIKNFEFLSSIMSRVESSVKDLEISRAALAGKASQNSVLLALAGTAFGLLLSSCGLFLSLLGAVVSLFRFLSNNG